MNNKVEIFPNYIIKHNTSKYSSGLEKFTEMLSINHQREIRVFKLYSKSNLKHLLIPNLLNFNNKYIKMSRIHLSTRNKIDVQDIIPNIIEFVLLGRSEKQTVFDFFSSPTQSVIRGLIVNFRFVGFKVCFQALKHLFTLNRKLSNSSPTYLIHKDLKANQNMICSEHGIYFIDFGSSILTKKYFLTDIVELATDHLKNQVNFELISSFALKLGYRQCDIKFLRSQIFLLLLRRTLHFGPTDKNNKKIMTGVKTFLDGLDDYVNSFNLGMQTDDH